MNVNHGIHHQKRIITKKTISKKFYYAGTTRLSVQQQTTSPINYWTITTLPPDSDEVNKQWTSTMGTHRQKELPPNKYHHQREASPKEKHHQKRSTTKRDLPPKQIYHPKRNTTRRTTTKKRSRRSSKVQRYTAHQTQALKNTFALKRNGGSIKNSIDH
jgi:hypothetical protein